jgi:hypothetical protein
MWNFALPTACQRASRRSTVLLRVHMDACVGAGQGRALWGALGCRPPPGVGHSGYGHRQGARAWGGVRGPGVRGAAQGFVCTAQRRPWGYLPQGATPRPPPQDRPVMRVTDPVWVSKSIWSEIARYAASDLRFSFDLKCLR